MDGVAGISQPLFDTIARWHPQFALAVLEGVPVHPNNRTLQATFSSSAVPQNKPASFDQQFGGPGFVSQYSIFTSFKHTLDPASGPTFAGQILQTTSDKMQEQITGITMTMQVKGEDGDYVPIPFATPVQSVSGILSPSAGIWKMDNAANVNALFTLMKAPAGGPPITVWCMFSFFVLAGSAGARNWLCKPRKEAYRILRDEYGIGCTCGPRAA
jgi:hypothetical protein